MSKEIEALIPHRYPFLFVDKIISADEKGTVATKVFRKEENSMLLGSFPEFDFIPGMIIIESMAQVGGAGVKQAGLAEGFFGLASMKNVRLFKGVAYDEEIKYVVNNIRVSNKIISQSGTAFCQNEPVAEASWICARID